MRLVGFGPWNARWLADSATSVARIVAICLALVLLLAVEMIETQAGERLGSYVLVEQLGAGGMGEVWRAEHAQIRSQVAIKLVLSDRDDRTAEARFLREATATAKVRHPGIVAVSDYGTRTGGGAYLVMELLDGESLAARLGRGSLPPWLAVELGAQIAKALGAAHDAGVIHRDLKPANIFLVKDGAVRGGVRAKVVDFGIARVVGSATDETGLTASGALIGTPLYMAPEQLLSRHGELDHRADLYALGLVLFEMVTGRPPFRGPTLGDLVDQHANVPPPSPRAFAPSVPPPLEALILALLAKDRSARPATAHDVTVELESIGDGSTAPALAETLASSALPTQLTSAPAPVRATVPTLTRGPSRVTLVIGSAIAIALVGTLVAVRASPGADSRRPAVTRALHTLNDSDLEATCREAARRDTTAGDPGACVIVRERELGREQPDLSKVFSVMSIACDRGRDIGCRTIAEMLGSGSGVRLDRARARAISETACTAGGASSCELAGELAIAGAGREPSPDIAHLRFARGCELGSAASCVRAMWTWRFGVGTTQDFERANVLEKRAWTLAEAGCAASDPFACRSLGGLRMLSSDPDRARGAADLQRACDLHYAAACTEVGVMYLNGVGVTKDPARAAMLLQRGCVLGDGNGCQYQGFFVALGALGDADVPRGFAIAKRACDEQGDSFCFALAGLYAMGVGAPADATMSDALYNRACTGGDLDACSMTIPRQPPTDGRDETASIRRMDTMCAAGGNGACLLAGDLALRHAAPQKAAQMYERACELSMKSIGCEDLASLQFSGIGTPRDLARARATLADACAGGAPSACYALGKRLRDGDGVPKQSVDAIRMFENACTRGLGMACLDGAALMSSEHSGLAADPKRVQQLRARGCEMEPTRCPSDRPSEP